MAAKKKAAKAGAAAVAVKNSPYVQRLVEDDDLRDNITQAYDSVRGAYARLTNGKPAHKAIFDDKKLQRDLRDAADNIREATIALREGPKKKKGGFGKLLFVSVVGAGLALALSEGLRKKVLDALFGAEEEFEYSSTTTPSTGTAATGDATTAGTAGATS
jgi:hypothetical protein